MRSTTAEPRKPRIVKVLEVLVAAESMLLLIPAIRSMLDGSADALVESVVGGIVAALAVMMRRGDEPVWLALLLTQGVVMAVSAMSLLKGGSGTGAAAAVLALVIVGLTMTAGSRAWYRRDR
ncbi:hypothetical protein [Stackebrandtia soli]|uniref:hypothetical protein n=1 Tax=Stackebrandtia soli TaxID=1892856 RepID=UPI0039EC7834